MIKSPFQQPEVNPRHIQVRRTPQIASKGDLIQLTVSTEVQDFFAQLMNKIGKRSDWFATCVTCFHWHKETSSCNKFHSVPPPEVIADGCEHYEDEDQIPF